MNAQANDEIQQQHITSLHFARLWPWKPGLLIGLDAGMQEALMNRFSTFLAVTFLSVVMLLPNMAQSIDIIQFDQMTN